MKMPFTGRRRAGPPSPLAQDPAEETKSATPLVAVELSRRACFTAGDLGSLCREGYARNPVVYRCVRLIAESAASSRSGATRCRAVRRRRWSASTATCRSRARPISTPRASARTSSASPPCAPTRWRF